MRAERRGVGHRHELRQSPNLGPPLRHPARPRPPPRPASRTGPRRAGRRRAGAGSPDPRPGRSRRRGRVRGPRGRQCRLGRTAAPVGIAAPIAPATSSVSRRVGSVVAVQERQVDRGPSRQRQGGPILVELRARMCARLLPAPTRRSQRGGGPSSGTPANTFTTATSRTSLSTNQVLSTASSRCGDSRRIGALSACSTAAVIRELRLARRWHCRQICSRRQTHSAHVERVGRSSCLRAPYCAPGWMLSWLRAVAPPEAMLRACVVFEGDELVGIAPFWTRDGAGGGRYGLLAEHTSSPVEPLCVTGREAEVGRLRRLAQRSKPSSAGDRAEGCARRVPLAAAPCGSRGRLLVGLDRVYAGGAATEDPAGPAEHGGVARDEESQLSPAAEPRAAARERGRGAADLGRERYRPGRRRAFPGCTRALADTGRLARTEPAGGDDAEARRADAGRDRFELLSIDVDGVSISAHLFVRAGGIRAYWLGGFDDRWADCRPSIQALAAAVEAGIASSDTWLELGPGGQPTTYRFADSRTCWPG